MINALHSASFYAGAENCRIMFGQVPTVLGSQNPTEGWNCSFFIHKKSSECGECCCVPKSCFPALTLTPLNWVMLYSLILLLSLKFARSFVQASAEHVGRAHDATRCDLKDHHAYHSHENVGHNCRCSTIKVKSKGAQVASCHDRNDNHNNISLLPGNVENTGALKLKRTCSVREKRWEQWWGDPPEYISQW